MNITRCCRAVECRHCHGMIRANIPHFAVFGARFSFRLCLNCLMRETKILEQAELESPLTAVRVVSETERDINDIHGF